VTASRHGNPPTEDETVIRGSATTYDTFVALADIHAVSLLFTLPVRC
jgi:hypothetical protein